MTQSSYLMSFIRSLMEITSKDDQEKNKRGLEKDYTETGKVLNTCLTEKYTDVSKILNVYNKVSESLNANRTMVKKIQDDLTDCKGLLNCNREELRRLWLELVEQRRCLELLDDIDRLRSIPDAVVALVSVCAWPEATDLIMHANDLLNSDIATVPALQSVKSEVAQKQKFLIDKLKKELQSLIFERPKMLVLEKLKRSKNQLITAQLQSLTVQLSDESALSFQSTRYLTLPLNSWLTAIVGEPRPDSNILKDPRTASMTLVQNASSRTEPEYSWRGTSDATSEMDWIRDLVAVVHCLVRLQKLPQLMASWSPQPHLARMQNESAKRAGPNMFSAPLVVGQGLLGDLHRFIVLKAVNHVESKALLQGDKVSLAQFPSPKYLVKLLRLVFDALFIHARACLLVIRTAKEAASHLQNPVPGLSGLTYEYVWSCVQYEIQHVLAVHLDGQFDVESGDVGSESQSLDAAKLDLIGLLGRKRAIPFGFQYATSAKSDTTAVGTIISSGLSATSLAPGTQPCLFRFANTSHSLSMSSYMRENRTFDDNVWHDETESTSTQYPLVCMASLSNIKAVYKPVMAFIDAVEREMASEEAPVSNATGGNRRPACFLRTHLLDFIHNTYFPKALVFMQKKLSGKLMSSEVLSATVPQSVRTELGLNRSILSIVYEADKYLLELKKTAIALPEFITKCEFMGTSLLEEFIGSLRNICATLCGVDASGNTLPSAEWARDEDLNRFWKEFPSWQRMAAQEARLSASDALWEHSQKKVTNHDLNDDALTDAYMNDITPASPSSDLLGSSESTNRITPATAVALGLYSDSALHMSGDLGSGPRLVIPFANLNQGGYGDGTTGAPQSLEFMRLPGVLCEREATRLAAKETEHLIHMIRDELPDKSSVHTLPTSSHLQNLDTLGRLSESLSWLSTRVYILDNWLHQLTRRGAKTSIGTARSSGGDVASSSPFSIPAKQLQEFAEACLLTAYLEIRIQAYNYFGQLTPSVATYFCPVDDVNVDKHVTDFLLYLEQVRDMLVRTYTRHKFRFLFGGLGDFISQLLLRQIPQIQKMNLNGNRKMCRNVYRLQQSLANLTETHESDLVLVKQLYELYRFTPETVVVRVLEEGAAFKLQVYVDLLELYQRSHPTHAYQKTQECIQKLTKVIGRSTS